MKRKPSIKKAAKSPKPKAGAKKNKRYESIIIMMSGYQTNIIQHQPVVIGFKDSHPADIMRGLRIHEGMKNNPWFSDIPGIDDLLDDYLDLIKKYRYAQGKVGTRKIGLAAERDALSFQFRLFSERLRCTVEGVCLANHDSALVIALSAAMTLRGPSGGRGRQRWRVKKGDRPAPSNLRGEVPETKSKRYCFQWQKTFTPAITGSWYFEENEIIPSLAGSKTVLNLPLMERVYLRYRVILPGDKCTGWSDVISIFIT